MKYDSSYNFDSEAGIVMSNESECDCLLYVLLMYLSLILSSAVWLHVVQHLT